MLPTNPAETRNLRGHVDCLSPFAGDDATVVVLARGCMTDIQERVEELEDRIERMDRGVKDHFVEQRLFITEQLAHLDRRLSLRIAIVAIVILANLAISIAHALAG